MAAGVAFFTQVSAPYPPKDWLVFFYARCWLFMLFFGGTSLIAGWRVQSWLASVVPRPGERLTIAFALGVLLFACGVFIAGLAGGLGRVFFFAWPLALMAFGARGAWRSARRFQRRYARFGAGLLAPRTVPGILACALLVLSLTAVYVEVMTPSFLGIDAQIYHLPVAEQYALSGRIRPFADGYYPATYPQLASLLYTWAFLAPGSLRLHTALASHLEWLLFLATLAGIAPLVRRLVGRRVPFAAAALFLFPAIFVYDSSLITTAEHVNAFWGVPIALAVLALARRFDAGEAALAGAMTAGAALTKYQSTYFLVPAVAVVLALAGRARRLRPLLLFGAVLLALSSVHWLKNWVFYGDPLYPLLSKYLPSHPLHADAARYSFHNHWPADDSPHGPAGQRLGQTVAGMFLFSFMHRQAAGPVFGSLFTLFLPMLVFVGAPRSLWLFLAAVHVGLAVWWNGYHPERFLQSLLPLMAAGTAAMLAVAWRRAPLIRTPLCALVLFQIVWGADAYFIQVHQGGGGTPLKSFVDFLAAGPQGNVASRDRPVGGLGDLRDMFTPAESRDTKVLVHYPVGGVFGAGVLTVNDVVGWQGGIFFPALESPAAAVGLLREMGVTHAAWFADRGALSLPELAGEAVFVRMVQQYGADPRTTPAGRRLARLGDRPQSDALAGAPTRLAYLTCDGGIAPAIYSPRGLIDATGGAPLARERVVASTLATLADANAIVLQAGCAHYDGVADQLAREFERLGHAGDKELWARARLHSS